MKDLKYGPPHLTQVCSCGTMWATEIKPEQINMGPTELARTLVPEQMEGYLRFCEEHEAQGHTLGDFGPMPMTFALLESN